VLLPGKGLAQGPFVSEEDIRSMTEVGHQEGSIAETERRMIHSVFEFSDTVAREIMVPRPDIVAVQIDDPLSVALEKIVGEGFSRLPVYRGDLDKVEGVLYAKDALEALHRGTSDVGVAQIMRPAHFVPQTNKATSLLREMQREKFHLAIVVDEYGSTAGLVTLENLLEQLVGDIADEHEHEAEREVEVLGEGRYRVDAALPIVELESLLGAALPHESWNTVGGLMFGLLGTIPTEGQQVELENLRFTAEKVQGRRVTTVLVEKNAPPVE